MSVKKKTVILLSAFAVLLVLAAGIIKIFYSEKIPENGDDSSQPFPSGEAEGVSMFFRTAGKSFYVRRDGEWNCIWLKGVNIGLTEATTDLSDPDVSYDTYMEWFTQISEMNANTVKVFTVMPPQFYSALHDFNAGGHTLYLLQGIWFNENYMYECDTAFSNGEMIINAFKRAAVETVDIIHGNSDYTDYGNIKGAVYNRDVSEYLAGYILGLEWDPDFVQRTNLLNANAGYSGAYLYTAENASAFETFLCEVGDHLISYETQTYSAQTPTAFLNWATKDTLTHTNEPFEEEDAVSVNTENILSRKDYYCGLFAAVDVYPYYPEFLNYQPEYLNASGEDEINTYKAYLTDLVKEYSVPLLIAEFGVSTSRGVAHQSVTGMNQGGLTEQEQGEAIVAMLSDIADCQCAGAMIFSWQDEWFKQTWNTYKYSSDSASLRTPNVQSAEQSYGILAMEPGENAICFIDGRTEDWKDVAPIQSGDITLKAQWDEAYLYLLVQTEKYEFEKEKLLLPIRTLGIGSERCGEYNVAFSTGADFIVVINGPNDSRVLTDSYEDLFYYTYVLNKKVFPSDGEPVRNSGKYNTVRQFLSNEIILPLSGEVIAPKYIESGLLKYGVTDPASEDFDNIADFYCAGGNLEIRIPWSIINVMNSTAGVCLGDFYSLGSIDTVDVPSVEIGCGLAGSSKITLVDTGYHTKEKSYYHTRLKKSYVIIQEALEGFMEEKREQSE